jgi:hypothetical protein
VGEGAPLRQTEARRRQEVEVKLAVAIVAALAFAGAASPCGIERWQVKTLTDPAARQINPKPVNTTIAQLASYPNERPSTRSAFEERKYRVHAVITAAKLEADEDIHLVITDNGHTMIAELPAQHCTHGAQFRWQMTVARRLAMTRLQPTDRWTSYQQPVTITGVGFLDRDHGQRGVAPNSVELHPVTGIRWR